MTREEIINEIKPILEELNYPDAVSYLTQNDVMWLNENIKALEQQPCEDCISRQAAIDVIEREEFKGDAMSEIEKLPSVIPQPKMGRWIMPQQDDGMSDPVYYQVRCSECNFDLDPQTWYRELHQYGADKFCPKCGVKMEDAKRENY